MVDQQLADVQLSRIRAKPVRNRVVPEQRVASDEHVVLLREVEQRIARAEVI